MAFRIPRLFAPRSPRHRARKGSERPAAASAPRPLTAPTHRAPSAFDNSRGRSKAGTAGHVTGPIGQPRAAAKPARRELDRRARASGLPTPADRRLGKDGREDPYSRTRAMYEGPRGRGRKGPSGAVPARVEAGRRAARSHATGRPAHTEYLPAGKGRATAPGRPLPGHTSGGKSKALGTQPYDMGPRTPNPRQTGREFASGPDPRPGGKQEAHPFFRKRG